MKSQHPNSRTAMATLTLKLQEDLLSTNGARLRARITQELDVAADVRPAMVEADICGARMVDSVGLNLLVLIIKRVGAWGGRTRIVANDANVLRTLQFTRLDAHAEIILRA